MKMTRLAAVASAFVLTAGLAACGGDSGGSSGFGDCELTTKAKSISLDTVTPDTLTVQATLPVPGWFNGLNESDISSGFEYCMAANIAHAAGLKSVTVKNVSFSQLVLGNTKDYDIALAESTITPERAKVVDFSEPYYESNIGILVQTDSGITEENITTKTLGAYTGTTSVPFVTDELGVKPKIYPNSQTLFQAVRSGAIDAAFLDTAVVLAQAKNSNDTLEVVGQYKTGEVYGAIYPKGSPNKQAIDGIIKQMKDEGVLEKLSETYLGPEFGGDPNDVPMWSTGN